MARTLVAPVSYGLGDLVVSLPAIQTLITQNQQVWLVARSPSQRLLAERIAGLDGVVDEARLTLRSGDRLIDLRDHPLQRDFWWGSAAFEAEFGRLNINDILQRICADLGINADFSRPTPLDGHPRADLGRTVLLVHETDGTAKGWPAERWVEVAAILRADGHAVAHVTRGAHETRGEGLARLDADIPALVVPTPGQAVDALSGCRAVIGIDTGLTHVAVQQSTPTVTICRRSSVYVRPWPHCAGLRGADCTDRCITEETSYAYNQTVSLRDFRPTVRSCPSASACLAGTRAEDAVSLLRKLL
jgi:Glycosyltransferase family 9 (heptosyltransferase)